MKIALLLVRLSSAFAYCCVPPLNDFRYLDNSTLLQEAVAKYTNDSQLNDATQLGWVHVFGPPGPIRTWPKNKYGYSIINFCYRDEFARNRLEGIRYAAWQKWLNKIGTAGSSKGHRLGGFEEVRDDDGSDLWCYTDGKGSVWNKKLPADTLVIDATVEPVGDYSGASSLGYISSEW
jgi:hypothetical protein